MKITRYYELENENITEHFIHCLPNNLRFFECIHDGGILLVDAEDNILCKIYENMSELLIEER